MIISDVQAAEISGSAPVSALEKLREVERRRAELSSIEKRTDLIRRALAEGATAEDIARIYGTLPAVIRLAFR
ncbi:hypothetical protein [Gryllotalpicola daejeonensis]